MTAAAAVYAAGVLLGLAFTDARWPTRVALALLWPLGPLAFAVVIVILFFASLIAFPVFGAAVVLAGLLAAAVLAQPVAQGSPGGPAHLDAKFIGNMAYAISDGRTTMVTDFPYESGYSVYMEYDAKEIRSSTAETFALITHRHGDHWDRRLFEQTNWKVIGPRDAVEGVAPARILRTLPNAGTRSRLTVGPIAIDALPTPHANIGHYSYLVTWHGLRLYFTGDTDDAAQLLEMKDLDVAFVSPWLFERARESGRRIDARRIVIYHHTADTKTIAGCAGACSVPAQGETLRVRSSGR